MGCMYCNYKYAFMVHVIENIEYSILVWIQFMFKPLSPGGRVLGLEKGTDCGPTAAEGWLSRPNMAKKRGLSSYHIV